MVGRRWLSSLWHPGSGLPFPSGMSCWPPSCTCPATAGLHPRPAAGGGAGGAALSLDDSGPNLVRRLLIVSCRVSAVFAGVAVVNLENQQSRVLCDHDGCRSAGAVPVDGLLNGDPVRCRLEMPQCGFELGGVDDEWRPELVGGLPHLPQQRREDARDGEQRRAGGVGLYRCGPSRGLGGEVEELPGGERLGRGKVPDLAVGCWAVGEIGRASCRERV